MNISEMIAKLEELREEVGDVEVMVLDGFNGGGSPRTINSGPRINSITESDAEECADCEGRVGELIVSMGYGSY